VNCDHVNGNLKALVNCDHVKGREYCMHSFKVPIFVYYVKTTLPILHKEKKFNPCTNRIMQLGNTITNMYVYFNYKLLSKLIENLSLLIFIFIVELKVHILLWTSMEVLWLWFC